MKDVPLDRVPLAPQYPFERPAGGVLQVPDRQKKDLQFGGFAYPDNRCTVLWPSPRICRIGKAEKGILKPQV